MQSINSLPWIFLYQVGIVEARVGFSVVDCRSGYSVYVDSHLDSLETERKKALTRRNRSREFDTLGGFFVKF